MIHVSNRKKILLVDDEHGLSYKRVLEQHNHEVSITSDREKCILSYKNSLQNPKNENNRRSSFDAVIIDYKMLKKDGMEVVKEILELNPNQRVMFASAYVKDTLFFVDSVKQLKFMLLMQNPSDATAPVEIIEDKEIYDGLEKLNVNVKKIKDFNPSHEDIRELLEGLREIMKGKTF
jgi:CheY-like chemotaxis protein